MSRGFSFGESRTLRTPAIGTKRTLAGALHMSAFGGKADIAAMSTAGSHELIFSNKKIHCPR